MQRSFTIGTRGSPLALWQARHVQTRLATSMGLSACDAERVLPIKTYTTSGDKLSGRLADFGGKGLFTKELERALMDGDIDMAVHSMKDVPTMRQEGLSLGAILERADPRDAFISPLYARLDDLPEGALIGTASLRRRAQLAHIRPDIQFSLLRGSVGTRLEKLAAGDCAGTFLAVAGLNRLEQSEAITQIIDADLMLNAPAQGAVGVELRETDHALAKWLGEIACPTTTLCVTAERAFLRALDGSCRTPIAALALMADGVMSFRGEVFSTDGQLKFERRETVSIPDIAAADALGARLGHDIRTEIGDRDIWDETA